MNILVLNGSPKGEYSITLQPVRYLEKSTRSILLRSSMWDRRSNLWKKPSLPL